MDPSVVPKHHDGPDYPTQGVGGLQARCNGVLRCILAMLDKALQVGPDVIRDSWQDVSHPVPQKGKAPVHFVNVRFSTNATLLLTVAKEVESWVATAVAGEGRPVSGEVSKPLVSCKSRNRFSSLYRLLLSSSGSS